MVEARKVAGLIQGQQTEHVTTVVPSVKRDSVLPIRKLARIITTRIILLTYVGNAKGKGLPVSTVTMVHPSCGETNIKETSVASMASGATVAATEATMMATNHAETFMTFMNYKLTICYRTSSKNKAATTAMMIMLMTQLHPNATVKSLHVV